jgi:predicted transcriptional regulator
MIGRLDHPLDLTNGYTSGHTTAMKTAISVPDDVFEGAERLARREGRSRSEVYSAAVREYVARHSPDEIIDALDRLVAELGDDVDPFVSAVSRRRLETTEW